MAKFFILIVVPLAVFLLWFAVVILIGRAFGVRSLFHSLRQGLTFSQHMWLIGVLGWGCGMWIATTFYDYLDWKYWGGYARALSAERLLLHAVLWPLGGLLFGWVSWNPRTGIGRSN